MKYNRYLIVGITLLTVLFLFMFSGAVSESENDLFSTKVFNNSENGYGIILLGIGLPLLLAGIYIVARMRKANSLQK